MADQLYDKLVVKWEAEGKRPRVTYQQVTYTIEGPDNQPVFHVLNSIERVVMPPAVVEPIEPKKKGKAKAADAVDAVDAVWEPVENPVSMWVPKEGNDAAPDPS